MADNRSYAIGIIAIILGASGLGLGAFSVVNFQIVEGPQGVPGEDGQDGVDGQNGIDGINGTDGIDGINGTLDNLVAIWESLSGSFGYDSMPIYVDDIRVNNSEYFYLQADSQVCLTRSGWYRFTIMFLWTGLNTGGLYRLSLNKNGFDTDFLERHYHNGTDQFYVVNRVVYASSDGDDIFRFTCESDSPADTFEIYSSQWYNKLVIEYVGEL